MSRPHQKIELTSLQDQVLTGLMLGDGSLTKGSGDANRNAHLVVGRAKKDADYLKYEANIFRNLLAPKYQKCPELIVCLDPSPDNRTGKVYPKCDFRSINNLIFTDWHNVWYRKINKENVSNGFLKIVPQNLQLSSITIAHWIADDGHIALAKPNLSYRFKLAISTNGFSKIEVEFLASLLNERYKEKFNVFCNRNQYYILAYDSACRAIFADIDPYFKMNRKRIWDKPESRFWSNQPERQVSSKDLFEWRVEKMEEIILNNDHLSLSELKMQLNYQGKSGDLNKFHAIFKYFTNQIVVDRSNKANYIVNFIK